MKKPLLSFLAVSLLGLAAFAQTVVSAPEPTEKLMRIQAEIPTGDVTAFFERSVTIGSNHYAQPWESVSWNNSERTVTVGGQTLTYSQVMQFVVAIAMQERAAQQAAAAAPPPAEPPPESQP